MIAPTLHKSRANGYDLIHLQNSWQVCTDHDRLAIFPTEQEARAYAFTLPAHMAKHAAAN